MGKMISAEDAETSERRKRQKQNADQGFSTYEAAAFRKYNQQVKSIQPNMERYEEQQEKREKYSRRRMHDDDADIDYINERNMKFNQKLERFYGKYTKEIKDNLERGTAV